MNNSKRTMRRISGGLAALALSGSLTIAGSAMMPVQAASQGGSPIVSNTQESKVTSRVTGTAEDGRRVMGTFTPQEFTTDGQTVSVVGELTGRMLGKGKPQSFSETVTMQVQEINGTDLTSLPAGSMAKQSTMAAAAAPGSCDVLNLVLGPLDLNLLGLEVHLNQVVLDIIAKSGAGNLLGNLLCGVAGLLDGLQLGALLQGLVDALNNLLSGLGLGV